jgi:hypothetical protein
VKTINQIIYYAAVIAFIGAPMLLLDKIEERGIQLPQDIRNSIFLVWYGTGLIFTWFNNKDKPKPPSQKRNTPSYTKDHNDWNFD